MAVYFTAAEFFLSKLQFIEVITSFIFFVTTQWGRAGSDFSVGSDCLNAVKAGPSRKQLSKYAESSAVGLPGASKWTAIFSEGVV